MQQPYHDTAYSLPAHPQSFGARAFSGERAFSDYVGTPSFSPHAPPRYSVGKPTPNLTVSAVLTHNLSHAEILVYETASERIFRALALRNALLPARALVGTVPNLRARATDHTQLDLLERLAQLVHAARANAFHRRFAYGTAYDLYLLTSAFLGLSPLDAPQDTQTRRPKGAAFGLRAKAPATSDRVEAGLVEAALGALPASLKSFLPMRGVSSSSEISDESRPWQHEFAPASSDASLDVPLFPRIHMQQRPGAHAMPMPKAAPRYY